MTNKTILKSNKLVEAYYRLSLNETRLILCAIKEMQKDKQVDSKKFYIVTAKSFSDAFDLNIRTSHRDIKSGAENLWDRQLKIESLSLDNEIVDTRWIQSKCTIESGQVSLKFSDDVTPYLLDLKYCYLKVDLSIVGQMNSPSTIRLYELLVQHKQFKKRSFVLDDFKELLGLESSYNDYKDFNKRVLTPAIKQINDISDIKISMTTERKGRSIHTLHFKITTPKAKPTKPKSTQEETILPTKVVDHIEQAKAYKETEEAKKKIEKSPNYKGMKDALKGIK